MARILITLFAALVLVGCKEGGHRDPCTDVECSDHGNCAEDGVSAWCVCDPGYHPEGFECLPGEADGDSDVDGDGDVDGGGDVDGDVDVDGDADRDVGPRCPRGMALVESLGSVCIDQYEASHSGDFQAQSAPGVMPWANVSWHEADTACTMVGKRLCESHEWTLACGGPEGLEYPYGETYESGYCNDYSAEVGETEATGAMDTCEGGYPGVFDMSGNVAEWTATCDGPMCVHLGGAYPLFSTDVTCTSVANVEADHTAGTIGFRCCQDL